MDEIERVEKIARCDYYYFWENQMEPRNCARRVTAESGTTIRLEKVVIIGCEPSQVQTRRRALRDVYSVKHVGRVNGRPPGSAECAERNVRAAA